VAPSQSKSSPRGPARKDAAVGAGERVTAGQRRQIWLRLGVTAAVLLVGAGLAVRWSQGREATTATGAGDLAAVSGLGAQRLPPWPAPTDASRHVPQAGLLLGAMGTAEHYHVHLDVLVNGQPVPVPANIGVDGASGAMSYVHTHDSAGVVHIEAGRSGQAFTLGQLFTQWDVRLSATQVGGLKAGGGNTLTAYVDGTKVPGNPAGLRLAAHQEIALVYGPVDQSVQIPNSYQFVPGD
jgi:hypothetical protein